MPFAFWELFFKLGPGLLKFSAKWPVFLGLIALMAAWGWYAVPAHWTSTWADLEFTGWVAPVANRLGPHLLYTEGFHSPLPPLSFVLVHGLFPGGAHWIDESALNFVFQSATLLLLFLALEKRLGIVIASATTLATMPVFYALPKTLLYDSMTQFWVACAGISAIHFFESPTRRGSTLRLAAAGGFVMLAMFSKQSTGVGALLGLALVVALKKGDIRVRLRDLGILGGLTAVLFCLAGLVLSPWASFTGLVHDVWLTGSEVKGGTMELASALGLTIMVFTACAGLFWGGTLLVRKWIGFPGPAAATSFVPGPPTPPSTILLFFIAFAAICAASYSCLRSADTGTIFSRVSLGANRLALSLGLLLSSVLPLFRAPIREAAPQTVLFLFFFCTAIFHSLSSPGPWRWAYDNNPVIACALASLVAATITGARRLFRTSSPMATVLAVGAVFLMMTPAWALQARWVSQCTRRWDEIPFLAGARLRPAADGMRALAASVNSLCDAHPGRTVLLLPNDPNVESWFTARPPGLSSAIIFTDQYWDRYVDDDFRRLEKDPPFLVVVGPRWRWRHWFWQGHRDWGADRLIDLVRTELLPARYSLYQSQEIHYADHQADHFDIYILKETP